MGRNHANRYALLDSHGKVAPGDVSEAIDTLVEYLITPCQNNEEKARVIFRWITENIQYDVQGYFSGNYGDLRPKTVLKTKKSVCSGYAALFEALCVQANVPCQRVVGFAKGYGHDTGHAFDKTNHEWNVIQLEDEQWYLVESTWGAGYINGKIYCKKYVAQKQN
jgi:transglutaminase/protease-like cytokinesis protein 3